MPFSETLREIRDGPEQKQMIKKMLAKRWGVFVPPAVAGAGFIVFGFSLLLQILPIWSLLPALIIAFWIALWFERASLAYEREAKWQDRAYFLECVKAASSADELVEAGLDLRRAKFAPVFSDQPHYEKYRVDVDSTSITLL